MSSWRLSDSVTRWFENAHSVIFHSARLTERDPFFPNGNNTWLPHTKHDKDNESLKRVKDTEEDLKGETGIFVDERKQTKNPGQTQKKRYRDCVVDSLQRFFSFVLFDVSQTRSLSPADQLVHYQCEDDCVDDYD